jgi:transcriptional regulator with XRE-family HTH domain
MREHASLVQDSANRTEKRKFSPVARMPAAMRLPTVRVPPAIARFAPIGSCLVFLAANVLCMRASRNHATNLSHVKRHKLHEIKRPAKRGQQPNLEKLPAIQPRELPPKIGARFHELRKARCLTLEQVQIMSGISKSLLSQIRARQRQPDICDALASDAVAGHRYWRSPLQGEACRRPQPRDGAYADPFHALGHQHRRQVQVPHPPPTALHASARVGRDHHGAGRRFAGESEVCNEDVVLQEGETLPYRAEVPTASETTASMSLRQIMVLIPPKAFGGSFLMPSRVDVKSVD